MATTNGGNDYQQMQGQPGAGEGNAPLAFNPDAVNPQNYSPQAAAPVYGAVPQQPQQPQPAQAYMAQQPVYNPQQVRYVNQYGQPLGQAPVVVVPPQAVQPTVIYAQAQPLIAPVPYKPVADYRNPSDRDRQKRMVATLGGLVTVILLTIAMSTRRLASGQYQGFDVYCSILYLYTDDYTDDLNQNTAYYSDMCWTFFDSNNWEYWANTDPDDWCDTWSGAAWWITCVVFGTLFTSLSLLFVQPFCRVERCCCPRLCPRIWFIFGAVLLIIGNVTWATSDKVCTAADAYDLNIGVSVDLVYGCCVAIFIILFCAK